jgi:CubicO group peptidase (beta-lactamase class C family)
MSWLPGLLKTQRARTGIPGAAIAILHRGELIEAADGVLNLSTGVEATPDSLFQIGSISKTFTATLVLQLVEQGRIGLDDPVRKHLPWFSVASPELSERVTIRHLLSHTSGIDGDWFPDTGTDSDCIEKYVRGCADLGQIHPAGEGPSYTNAGPIILAAMLRELTGKTWDAQLCENILEPLNAQRMTTDFAELPRYRVAVGHLPDPESKQPAVPKHLHLPRGMGPTGSTLHASAADLARFGATFLPGAKTKLLRDETIARSREVQGRWPTALWQRMSMGLGWLLYDWDGHALFGHDGATVGQYGFLRIAPHADLVVALLCNGAPAKNLYYGLFREIFGKLANTRLPEVPQPIAADRFDRTPVVGTYQNKSGTAEVFVEGGELKLRATPRELTYFLTQETSTLQPVAENCCRIVNPALDFPDLVVFHHLDGGRARYLTLNQRDLPRQK